MVHNYPWYEAISGNNSLEQGDILDNWAVNVPQSRSGEVIEKVYSLILMTQSCDISDGITHLIFCPVWTREQLALADPKLVSKDSIGNLIKGRMIGFYPINKSILPTLEQPWRIIQFQRIIEIETAEVKSNIQLLQPHLRLMSPYKESLSQAFARFFMRVGLPVPVDTN